MSHYESSIHLIIEEVIKLMQTMISLSADDEKAKQEIIAQRSSPGFPDF